MFDNIGEKIKTVAKVNCWIGIIAYAIIGIILLAENNNELIGFSILILGPLFSWISSFITYGFGQLVENSDKLLELHSNEIYVSTQDNNEPKVLQLKLLQEKGLISEEELKNKLKEIRGGNNE